MKKHVFAVSLVLATSLLGGCSWVKVSEAGKRVNILTSDQAYSCTRVGTISTSVKDTIIGIERNRDKVQTELDRLARDQAVLMQANSIVRESIRDGLGSYIAYNCP